jgi:tetratricopeptide (TPR) repeat protein
MRLKRFFWIASTTVLLIVSQTFRLNFSMPLAASPVVAQTSDARKAEAARLLQQGNQQLQTSQFEAAKQSFQQALAIYREMGDSPNSDSFASRTGEGKALVYLGLAYFALQDYAKVIDYMEPGLAIAQAINDPQLEKVAREVLSLAQQAQRLTANLLLQLGIQQLQTSKFQAALQSYQQALAIYPKVKDRQGEGKALGMMGLVYLSLQDYPKAIEYSQQCLAVAREVKDRDSEGKALGNMGLAYLGLKDYPKAIEYSQQWLAIAKGIKDRDSSAKALGNLGRIYLEQGDSAKAIEYFQQVLAIARQINNLQLVEQFQTFLQQAQSQNNPQKVQAQRLIEQGYQQRQAGQFEAALQSYQQALTIYQQIKDRQGEGLALANLGNAYNNRSDFAKAIEYLQQALKIVREINDRETEGRILSNLGVAYLNLKNYAKAIEYLQQGLAVARETKDPQLEQQVQEWLQLAQGQSNPQKAEADRLIEQGNQQLRTGQFQAALQSFQQALNIYQQIKDRGGEGRALAKLSLVYANFGDSDKAVGFAEQSLAIAREIRNQVGVGEALNNLGTVYLTLGDYAKAIWYTQQSLESTREIKDRQGEGAALGNLGIIYMRLGDYAKAIDYHQQDLNIARDIKDRQGEGQALANLGAAYLQLQDYGKTIEYLQQSLAIAREFKAPQTEAQVLGNLGGAYLNLGDYKKAIEYFQQVLAIARAIKDSQSEGMALVNLGFAYTELGDYKKAIEYEQQSLAILREIKNRYGESMALKNLGLTLFKEGNLAQAETTLMEAIKVQESLRGGLEDTQKISIFETQLNTYETLQQILIAQDKTNEALEISERGRARAFLELVASRLSPNPTTAITPEPPKIQKIKQIAKEQNATIVQYSIFNSREIVHFIPLSNSPATENSEPQIEHTNKSELYVWIIEPNGKVTFRSFSLKFKGTQATTDGSALQKLVTETLASLGVGEDRNGIFEVSFPAANPELQTNSLKLLHFFLIQPIADLLPTDPNKRVIFVPDQDLFRIPFAALIDSEGKYLIEKHTILTTPSIQLLELTHLQRKNSFPSGQAALVVGNPSPMPSGFQPLKGAEKEALDVAQLLKTKPLIGSQATEPAVLQQLPNARIIHLATHGTFNEQQPLLGGVALAQTGRDTQNDGVLTAEEIFNLKSKLNAELLVLSACNTGRGRITGDGVIGLSRSFIAAGIPSVLVSLWSVPDAPTAELMTQFYTNLYQKKLDKAQALRMAMLKMMENHRDNPRAWAAFTLIGEAE